jgi:hypothetical protein
MSPALKEIHDICWQLRDEKISALLACQEIAKRIDKLHPSDPFHANGRLFIELDANVCAGLPLGDASSRWNPEALKSKDTEIAAAEARVGPAIRKECENILRRKHWWQRLFA